MNDRTDISRGLRRVVSVAVVTGICTITMLGAQQRGAEQAPATPRETATDELVGYWVSVISEDWRWRMVTPAKGDVTSIPLTPAGLALASQWDPARDAAMGEACKSYGAPGLMRAPTRLSITWADDQTLRVDTDYGEQTRLLHFGEIEVTAEPSLQGHSVAEWESLTPSRDGGRPAGHLRVDTSHLTSGYLRKNGVPYSADTLLTEYWDVFDAPNADRWLVITSVVHDPENLQLDWITSLNFKQEPNGANWNPTPCSTEW